MKTTVRSIVRIAGTLLALFAFASASFAANPLSYPWGLALDSNGNLYVANANANNILVFSPGYQLQTAMTITQGISLPSGVAFDPLGHLWVANSGSANGAVGSVTEYINGVFNPSGTITNGIFDPTAIASDGLGNIYVLNDYSNVTIYDTTVAFAPSSNLLTTTTPSNPVYAIAAGQGTFSWSDGIHVIFLPATCNLQGSCTLGVMMPSSGIALTSDSQGNVYSANLDRTVTWNLPIYPGVQGGRLIQLSFLPSGIAVDASRGRIYISDALGNAIWVYTTTGTFLRTIK
jgi:NHL repeat